MAVAAQGSGKGVVSCLVWIHGQFVEGTCMHGNRCNLTVLVVDIS